MWSGGYASNGVEGRSWVGVEAENKLKTVISIALWISVVDLLMFSDFVSLLLTCY